MRLAPLLVIFALAGCTTATSPLVCAIGAPALTADLYFGRSLHGGGNVSDTDWRSFLASEVTPRFPDGLTVFDGYGQWRHRTTNQVVSEPSTVVVIVTEPGAETMRRLDAVRDAYRTRFNQESVGLVTEASCASF